VQGKQYSKTAWMAAVVRAAHQTLDHGSIFPDPLACRMLGSHAEASVAAVSNPEGRRASLIAAVRSRFAEDRIAACVAAGVRQAVVLGAGLDTFGLRNPYPELTVFEVDHPSTQALKQGCIKTAGLTVPETLRFVPVNFEHGSIDSRLSAAGFDRCKPACFLWLAVVVYLTLDAILKTLDFVATVPGSELVLDYFEPLENYPIDATEDRQNLIWRAKTAAELGEPFISYFQPQTILTLLTTRGFTEIEDLEARIVGSRYVNSEGISEQPGAHILRATRV
jgi:methyltransferase (TIGR00027 family)